MKISFLADGDGRIFKPIRVEASRGPIGMVENIKLYFPAGFTPSGLYQLYAGQMNDHGPSEPSRVIAGPRRLENEFVRVDFSPQGLVAGVVYFQGRRVLDQGGLGPLISYRSGDQTLDHRPEAMTVEVLEDGSRGAGVVRPERPVDGSRRPAGAAGPHQLLYLTLLPGRPYLYVEASVGLPPDQAGKLCSAAATPA